MCRRATGRRIASEATEQTMNTISEPIDPAPSRSATAAAPAASATGPRKKSPGVSTSPTARATATSTHRSHTTMQTIEAYDRPVLRTALVGVAIMLALTTGRSSDAAGGCRLAMSQGPGFSERTGQHTLEFVLTNRGSSACVLDGYPQVEFVDAAG